MKRNSHPLTTEKHEHEHPGDIRKLVQTSKKEREKKERRKN